MPPESAAWDSPTPFLFELLNAIADARDDDLTELPPIGAHLDTDALGRFVASTSVPATITLELLGCRVTIDAGGSVSVTHRGATDERPSGDGNHH